MALFDIATIGTSNNQITFNDDTADPYYRARRRSVTRREVDEFDIKLPEQSGDADFESWIGKSYLVLDGKLYPGDDPASLDEGKKALRKLASLEYSQADNDADEGYVPYKWPEEDGYDKQIFLKVMYVDMPETTSQTIPFRLLCKIKQPKIYSQEIVTSTIGSTTSSTSGSSNLSFTLPRAIGLTTYNSTGAVTLAGDLSSYPLSITITGPITTPRITNSSTGEYIEVDTTLADSSESLSIIYDEDSLSITQGGNSKLDKLSSSSTLFKLRSGVNDLVLTGATIGSGATASIPAYHTWPLS